MATLAEIEENPDLATPEDKEYFRMAWKAMLELYEHSKLYEGISSKNGREINTLARNFYQEYSILAAILEAFVIIDKWHVSSLNKWVFSYVDKTFYPKMTVIQYKLYIHKLCRLGLIEEIKEDVQDGKDVVYHITERGLEALRQQTFSNMAQTALFNYQASMANNEALKINKKIRLLTILAVGIAIISMLLSII